jgi:hypothetical protein
MYFHVEIRDVGEIDRGEAGKIKESELQLALRLIEEPASEEFDPNKYDDEYRRRVLALVKEKAEGKAARSRSGRASARRKTRERSVALPMSLLLALLHEDFSADSIPFLPGDSYLVDDRNLDDRRARAVFTTCYPVRGVFHPLAWSWQPYLLGDDGRP